MSEDGYDFSDWEPFPARTPSADLEELACEVVRENLRQAFKAFARGLWTCTNEDRVIEWMSEWDADPIRLVVRPEDVRDALLSEVRAQVPFTGAWAAPAHKAAVAEFGGDLERWRMALAVVQAEIDRLLALPDGPPKDA